MRLPAASSLPSTSAAYGTAPEGSTMIFITSQIVRMARTIDSSDTVDDRIDIALNLGKGLLAERAAQAIGNGLRMHARNDVSGLERTVGIVRPGRLNTDHADVRVNVFGGDRDAT